MSIIRHRRYELRLELHGLHKRSVTVEGANVKIVKAGGLFSGPREKTLPIRNITSVEIKKPGAVWVGFIQFSIAGGTARDSSFTISGGSVSAAQDENSVMFNDRESHEIALRIKEYVVNYSEAGQVPTVSTNEPVADEIRKLRTLVDEGILTEEEFAKKKQQMLGI